MKATRVLNQNKLLKYDEITEEGWYSCGEWVLLFLWDRSMIDILRPVIAVDTDGSVRTVPENHNWGKEQRYFFQPQYNVSYTI